MVSSAKPNLSYNFSYCTKEPPNKFLPFTTTQFSPRMWNRHKSNTRQCRFHDGLLVECCCREPSNGSCTSHRPKTPGSCNAVLGQGLNRGADCCTSGGKGQYPAGCPTSTQQVLFRVLTLIFTFLNEISLPLVKARLKGLLQRRNVKLESQLSKIYLR